MSAPSSPLLEARSAGRRDPASGRWLLEDVSLAVDRGQRTALVGPTGSGKTVLLRALVGLDPLDTGHVLWRGEEVGGPELPDLRRQAMLFPQRPALGEGTVEEALRLPFTFRVHRDRSFSRDAVLAWLGRVGRGEELLERSVADLSGGEAQVVALLRGLQLEPALLLLDEPTASLDEESTRSIEGLLGDWFGAAPSERALLWVSHGREQVARVADRVVRMRAGRIEGTGDADGDRER